MREHKYQAWHTKHKKMYTVKGWMQGDYGVPGVFQDLCVYCVDENGVTERFADGLVVLRGFTGITDKSGREVYEGDIIKAMLHVDASDKQVIEQVYYSEECAAFAPFCHLLNNDDRWIDCLVDDTVEVIGNVYEHPDLIQKEQA